MFTPDGHDPAKLRLDKCQPCGEWTPAEEAVVTARLQSLIAGMQDGQRTPGGCNCTGKR